MTYQDLRDHLNKLTEEQLNRNVKVLDLDIGECLSVLDFVGNWDDWAVEANAVGLTIVRELLHKDHPYLTVIGL